MILLGVSLVAIFIAVLRFVNHEDRKPIFGVYSQRSRWFPLKLALFLAVFYTFKYAWRALGIGKRDKGTLATLDKPLELLEDIKAFDGVLFTGGNRHGYYFVMAAERCHGKVVNGYFYLLVPRKGLFCSSKLPDTILFGGGDEHFGAEGIAITPSTPMRKWNLSFKGAMWLYPDKSNKVNVRFTAQWSSSFDVFDCFEDFNPLSLAKSVATEPWSAQFFESMRHRRSLHVHYYQMGAVRVESTIAGERHNFRSLSFRSRQSGMKRTTLHRSVFFHIFLDDGMMAVVGVLFERSKITEELGYVQKPDGTINVIEWCDFQLYQHGEYGRPPVDHGFQFKAGGTTYAVQVKVLFEYMHFTGWNWETKVIERFVTCVVNGVPGQGTSEFRYRNAVPRPDIINSKDPPWFQVYRPHYIYS